MWITLNLNLTAIFLPLATGVTAMVYALLALGSLFVALVAQRPARPLRVAAWSGGLAVACVLCTAPMVLVELPSPDDDLVHALLWLGSALFLGGVGLIVWQGRRGV